jgi:hypothetical protein
MDEKKEKINRAFDLISELDEQFLSNILKMIDPIIFMLLIQESMKELDKIKDEISTRRINNNKLNESGSFEKSNRGGSDLYKSIIEWNNEDIEDDYQKESVLREKIREWKLCVRIHEKPYTHKYTLLKPKEKIEYIRNEVNLKSIYFHFNIFQIVGPIIYYHLLKEYKFKLKTIEPKINGYSHYANKSTDNETREYYALKFKENNEAKKRFESLFDNVSIEFFNLYNQE